MKKSTKIILASALLVLDIADMALIIKKSVDKYKSANALNSRINVLATPSHGSRKLVNALNNDDTHNELTPLCKDMFELGYNTGRRDELVGKTISVEENNKLINTYLGNI